MNSQFKVFVDSNGVTHRLENMQEVLSKVANDWEQLGYDIKKQNLYANHVTEEIKEKDLQRHIDTANEIRNGVINSFTIWQKVNTELTGNCVALLP